MCSNCELSVTDREYLLALPGCSAEFQNLGIAFLVSPIIGAAYISGLKPFVLDRTVEKPW